MSIAVRHTSHHAAYSIARPLARTFAASTNRHFQAGTFQHHVQSLSKQQQQQIRGLSDIVIASYQTPNSAAPLLEHYRSSWPDPYTERPAAVVSTAAAVEKKLPPRTVPDSCLRFEFTAVFKTGEEFYYKHLPTNPENFKVVLRVFLDDLNLDDDEKCIMLRMVGPRYNVGRREIKLTEKKFPNRLENKKYLVLLLERLLAECRRLNASKEQFQDTETK